MLSLRTAAGYTTIELASTEKGNALSAALVERLMAAISDVVAGSDTHTLIIRGRGRHLCTGFDLCGLSSQSDGDLLHRFIRIELMLQLLWRAPIRTIAIGSGRVVGAGADLFAACDLRIAVPSATFRFPGGGFGIVLGTRRLAARIGPDRARDWLLNGQEIEANVARTAGLVTDVVEAEEMEGWISRYVVPPRIDAETVAGLHRAMRGDDGHADLANLVRSGTRPGLRHRIEHYVRGQGIPESALQ